MRCTTIAIAILATSLAVPALAKQPVHHGSSRSLNAFAKLPAHGANAPQGPSAPKSAADDPNMQWELRNEAAHGLW
jgi:hypothetical protein